LAKCLGAADMPQASATFRGRCAQQAKRQVVTHPVVVIRRISASGESPRLPSVGNGSQTNAWLAILSGDEGS
jgi:hypothetical protein